MRFVALAWLAMACVLPWTREAAGQDFIARANALYDDIVESRRSDPILLPALAELTAPPLGVDTPDKAAIAFVGAAVWPDAVEWVSAPPQQAVIEALERGTVGERYDTAMAFAQRYGPSAPDLSLIRETMYTALGDPPLLAAARHLYMERFDDLRCLVHLEATRRAGEGQPIEAMRLLLSMAQFGYQMADREFLAESQWGYRAMIDSLRRIRDIAYVDFQGERVIDPPRLKEIIDPLDPRDGPIRLDRLNFPRANKIAAEQLVDVLYIPRDGVDRDRFVPTMVRLATTEYPLRRFSAASKYEELMDEQKDWFDIDDVVTDVFADWEKKWELDRWDPLLALPFAWESGLVGPDAVVVREGVGGDMSVLFDLRTVVELERVGTRQALGVLGRYYVTGSFPPRIDAIRPRWVDRLGDDPLNTNRPGGRRPPMRYFRPVLDDYLADERAEREPHEMQVFPGDGTNFQVVLYEDQFLMYSTGADGQDNHGVRMSQDPESLVGDYIIWPPLLGLHRTHLRQIGELN
jgi:hypothetical protein